MAPWNSDDPFGGAAARPIVLFGRVYSISDLHLQNRKKTNLDKRSELGKEIITAPLEPLPSFSSLL